MAKASPQRKVQCYHCRHRFDISSQAMSVPCPKCAKALIVEDVIINNAHNVRKIQTCGKVVIEKKGRVVAQLIEAHEGVFVEGILEAKVLSGGPVKIGAKAHWKGDCSAPSITIELGSRIDHGFFTIPDNSLGIADLIQHPTESPAPPAKPAPHRAEPSSTPHKAEPSPAPQAPVPKEPSREILEDPSPPKPRKRPPPRK